MKTILVLALLAVAGLLAYIRLAPSEPARWHVDPLQASDPGQGGVLLRYPVDVPPVRALEQFDAVALAEPRVAVLAGSVRDRHITYVARSKWIGFPDYVTVKAVDTDRGAELVVLSRLRFGANDLGVNAERLDRWLDALQAVP